jgi:CoA:oxalate CoA-transferase
LLPAQKVRLRGAGNSTSASESVVLTDTKSIPILRGVRVLDLTHVLAGPYATMLLADLGADVIKVEKPGRGDTTRGTPPFAGDLSHYFAAVNWGKRSVAIDLKRSEGRALLLRLVERTDIVVDNFRPGTMEALDLGYDVLRGVNARIIRCTISGFGQTGPLSKKPAFDAIVQAMSGFMAVTGERGGAPLRCGVSVGDVAAGAFAVAGIALALYRREQTGVGQEIDVAMFDSLVSFMTYYLTLYQVSGEEPPRVGSEHASMVPLASYPTKDGYVVIAAFNDSFWKRMCEAIGHRELTVDARFQTVSDRQRNRDACNAALRAIFATRPTQEWVDLLESVDVPVSSILGIGALLAHPHLAARDLLRTLARPDADLKVAGQPLKMSDHQNAGPPLGPPELGQDTRSILSSLLDVDEQEYQRLQGAGIVG